MTERKKAERALAQKPVSKKRVEEPKLHGGSQWAQGVNHKENALVDAIDKLRMLTKYGPMIEALSAGKITLDQFAGKVAPDVFLEILNISVSDPSSKMRLEASKDVLDRAGFTAVKKVAVGVGQLDASAPRAQLESIIMGLAGKTQALEIEDDDDDDIEVEPAKD